MCYEPVYYTLTFELSDEDKALLPEGFVENLTEFCYEDLPIRKVGISVGKLTDNNSIQLNLFENYEEIDWAGVDDLSETSYEKPEKDMLECPHCHHQFKVNFFKDLLTIGSNKGKKLTCPSCKKTDYVHKISE